MENKKLQEVAMTLTPGGDTGGNGTDRPTTGGGTGGTQGDDPK